MFVPQASAKSRRASVVEQGLPPAPGLESGTSFPQPTPDDVCRFWSQFHQEPISQ